MFQQLVGINTLMYYSATVVQMAGIGSASSAIWITAAIAFLYFLACFIGVGFVEKLGRRNLLLLSLGTARAVPQGGNFMLICRKRLQDVYLY